MKCYGVAFEGKTVLIDGTEEEKVWYKNNVICYKYRIQR